MSPASSDRRWPSRTLWLIVAGGLVFLGMGATRAAAQLIPIRTVPVASGDQFLFLPSQTLGMGGVTLAVDDTLGDPWSHPARGARLPGSAFLSSPTLYGISDDGGSGRTFPVAGVFTGEAWFGGVAAALQQVDNDAGRTRINWTLIDPFFGGGPSARLSDRSNRNLFVQGFVGRRLGDGPWSIGVGVALAELDAMDGVDLLYANAERIEEDGTLADYRIGLFRDGEDQRLSLEFVHNRVDMTHDVTRVEWVPGPGLDVAGPWGTVTVERRVQTNEDRTRTWGAQVGWDRELDADGWRLGLSGTVNRKSHPKIPDYEIQNIPRDPGTTWAYDFGVGLARSAGATTFGVDVVVQPIWSHTWQEAEGGEVGTQGRTFAEGDRTIENDFFFTNLFLRGGLDHQWSRLGVQAGVEVRSYDYDLEQQDHLAATVRDQEEAWMEWSPTVGASWRFGDVEVGYVGRLTTGTGQPGVTRDIVAMPGALESAGGDFLVAPEAPLTLQDARVLTHQMTVRVPIR